MSGTRLLQWKGVSVSTTLLLSEITLFLSSKSFKLCRWKNLHELYRAVSIIFYVEAKVPCDLFFPLTVQQASSIYSRPT